MDVEFFVHGIPNGEDFWGKEEERAFFGTFYDGSSDRLKFAIQARAVGGKPYFYYSYLVYANVVDNNSRQGSYFGMTLRLDEFCNDFMNMYRILDTMYNSYAVGKLLKNDRSKLKYSVPKFDSFNINGIYDKVMALLQDTLSNDSFSRIGNIAVGGSQYRKWNLYDCTKESFATEIKQYGKIALSPYYPSISESTAQQQCENKIKTIQQQCQAQISESVSAYAQKEQTSNATINTLKSQIAQLDSAARSKDTELENLREEVSNLKSSLEQERQNKDIAKLIEQIKEPVKSLADILGERKRQNHASQHGHKHIQSISSGYDDGKGFKLTRILPYIIAAVVVVVICLGILKWCGKEEITYTKAEQPNTEQAASNQSEHESTAEQSTEGNESDESSTPENPFSVSDDFDINNVRIDIKNFHGGNLKIGTTYEVRAKNGSESGEWEIEGCDIAEKQAQTIKITPTTSSVTIKYKVGDKEKPRNLTAE